jgi:hypothetical protein
MKTKTIAVLAALILVLTACEDEGGSAGAEAWAAAMCGGLEQFTSAISVVTSGIQTLETQDVPVEEKRDQFVTLIDQGATATEGLIRTLETTAVPEAEGAQDAVDHFIEQMEEMKTVFEDASDRFAEIDPSNPKKAEQEATAAATEMQTRFVELQAQSTGLTGMSPELDEAINSSAECQGVLASPTPAP